MTLTTLEYVLLAQLDRRAQTGYELGKALDGTPMGIFSGSPGSIYPALDRLEETRLVRGAEVPRGRRPRREFHPTAKGRRWLGKWIQTPITTHDLLRQPGVLALRYAFAESKDERLSFLRGYADAAREGCEAYGGVVDAARQDAVETSMGALELVRDLLATHQAWAERELRRAGRRKP